MPQRKNLMLAASVALPLSLVYGSMPAHAQNHPIHRAPCPRAEAEPAPAPVPAHAPAASPGAEAPSAPAAEVATSAPPQAGSAPPPVSAESPDAPAAEPGPVPPEERPLVDLAASAAARAEPPPAPSDAMRELDDVLSGEAGDPLATMEPIETPSPPSTESPSPEETTRAIERVMPSVRACVGDDASGVVVLRIVFLSSGRATTVLVQTQSAHLSHAQRACIARAARRAQVSAFQRSHFAASYPVRL
jgi:hypothetical protein